MMSEENLGLGKTALTKLDFDCLSHGPNLSLAFENVISLEGIMSGE